MPLFINSTRKGAVLVEYGILLSLISVVAIGAVNTLGEKVENSFSEAGNAIADVRVAAAGAGGAGGSGDGDHGHEGEGEDEYCPPEGWTWNESNSSYTLSGLSSLHGQHSHGGNRSSLTPPGQDNIVIQVPNPSALDLWTSYAYERNGIHYWGWTGHLEAEELQPPGAGC